MPRKDEMLFEDWKKEYEKILLSKKYSEASAIIGECYRNPTIESVKRAYASVMDYVTSIPLPINEEKTRKKFLKPLDEISQIIYGVDSPEVNKLCQKYKVVRKPERVGIKIVKTIHNLPNLIKALRDVLIQAGDFSTSKGLRVTLSQKKKIGMERILEEEGIDDL